MALIAVDWGTTRLRAYRLDAAGAVVERTSREDGVMQVRPGDFPETLQRHIGAWVIDDPGATMVLAGMVGSRNGWVEAPYARLPCGPAELAKALVTVTRADGGAALIVPGVAGDAPSGLPDVIRGEETLALGAGVSDGFLCLPGTHSKWIEMRAGRIVRFASFMTGESFGLFRNHSILGRLAETPVDEAGMILGAGAATRKGGPLHTLFSTRTRVLAGDMSGRAVEPYLSALLIRAEIEGALELFADLPKSGIVRLVAEGALADTYQSLLASVGFAVDALTPEQAFLDGLRALFSTLGPRAK